MRFEECFNKGIFPCKMCVSAMERVAFPYSWLVPRGHGVRGAVRP